jgi:hypothetical protein
MAEIVNLRMARKRKTRADSQARAEENRVRFGRTRAQKAREAAARDKAERSLDAHRRDPGDDA